jgi:hypothetical protein
MRALPITPSDSSSAASTAASSVTLTATKWPPISAAFFLPSSAFRSKIVT